MLFLIENIVVRKMNNDSKDMSLLLEWLTTPAVVELAYGEGVPWDMEKVKTEFGEEAEGNSAVTHCLIVYEREEIGYIQFYPIEEDSYVFNENVPYAKFVGGYGVDLFIGEPSLWGKGVGAKLVSAMSEYLMSTYNAKVVCADPEENNKRSIKCWTKAGFSPMGEICNYDDYDKTSIFMARFR